MGILRYRLPTVDLGATRRVLERFRGEVGPQAPRLGAAAVSLVAASLVTLVQPWPLKVVFDNVFSVRQGSGFLAPPASWSAGTTLWVAAVSYLALAALKGLFTYGYNLQLKVVEHRLTADIRLRVFSHVQRLPQSYHDYRETGDVLTRATSDVQLLTELLVSAAIGAASHVLLLAGMLVVLFWMDPPLALVALAMIPFFALAAFGFAGPIRSSAHKQREAYGRIVTTMQESLAGIAQVKAFSQEKRAEKQIGRAGGRDVKANLRTTRLTENYARTVEMIGAAGTCGVLVLGGFRVLAGSVTPGDLLIVLSYLRSMYRPLRDVARLTGHAAKAVVRGEKIVELLDVAPETTDADGAISARDIRGEFRFSNVSFAYAGGKTALSDASFSIPAGRTTLIVGASGAGKSTIAKLLLRLYEPQAGVITLDGRDIRDFRIESLRKRISPLAQDLFLFRSSIVDNIAFGMKRCERSAVEQAAERVGADAFIRSLPSGYDTLVGEGGLTLSGGQRQRISFARALVRNSPVMIFDEPATGLDVHAEAEAKELLDRVRVGRTVVVITHRLHFLDLADHVVFVHDGRVAEEGSPAELAARRGDYWTFIRGTAPAAAQVSAPR